MRLRDSEKDGWQLNQSHWNFFRITDLHQLKQSPVKDEVASNSSPSARPWHILLECSILTRQAFLGYSILCKSRPGA
ncbi:MAG: hypothetical protein WBP65_16475 [Candidatus Sulfotelmatobacter sp.]|jgi:hypothetical protein